MPTTPIGMAFVTSLPGYGGGEKWFLETARAMSARGHRVLMVGQPGSEIVRRAVADGLSVAELPMHGVGDVRTLWRMRRLLGRERIDTAFTNQAREIRIVAAAAFVRRDFRLIARRGSPDPIKNVWHYRWLYGRYVHRLVVNCRALVPKITGDAPWFSEDKVRVIYNGIDVEAYAATASAARAAASLGLDDDVRVVSMVGEVGARKDQATFLKAIAAWRRDGGASTGRPVVFLIAGEGDDRSALEAMGRELGLDDCVRWLGFRRDVPDLLARSDLLVLPTREEGFPNTLLEGMALGVPVIATPVDGIPELVVDGESGWLTPPGDAEALGRALSAMLNDEPRRRALGEAGRRRVGEAFTQEQAMDAVEKLVVASPGSSGL